MVLPRDMQPLFYAATAAGCAPHVITADGDFLVTKRGMVYTVLCFSIIFVSCLYGVYVIAIDIQVEEKLLLLTGIRTAVAYTCLFTDMILTLAWNSKIRTALSQLRIFDRATNYNETQNKKRVRWVCYGIVAFITVFWSIVGYISYCCEDNESVYNGVTYGLINAVISMQLMKFVGLAFLVCERFQRLGKLLLLPEGGKVMVIDMAQKQMHLQEVWWLHSCLADAFDLINFVYGAQLLFWIAHFFLNTLSRLYTFTENSELPIFFKTREFMLVSAYVTFLLLIATTCHVTADQGNKIGKIAFSPLSSVIKKRNNFIGENNIEAATYFKLRKVHFVAGGGLLQVDLPLLLSIASGITTYLVMLHATNKEITN